MAETSELMKFIQAQFAAAEERRMAEKAQEKNERMEEKAEMRKEAMAREAREAQRYEAFEKTMEMMQHSMEVMLGEICGQSAVASDSSLESSLDELSADDCKNKVDTEVCEEGHEQGIVNISKQKLEYNGIVEDKQVYERAVDNHVTETDNDCSEEQRCEYFQSVRRRKTIGNEPNQKALDGELNNGYNDTSKGEILVCNNINNNKITQDDSQDSRDNDNNGNSNNNNNKNIITIQTYEEEMNRDKCSEGGASIEKNNKVKVGTGRRVLKKETGPDKKTHERCAR